MSEFLTNGRGTGAGTSQEVMAGVGFGEASTSQNMLPPIEDELKRVSTYPQAPAAETYRAEVEAWGSTAAVVAAVRAIVLAKRPAQDL